MKSDRRGNLEHQFCEYCKKFKNHDIFEKFQSCSINNGEQEINNGEFNEVLNKIDSISNSRIKWPKHFNYFSKVTLKHSSLI